jgi:hypothetical protein
MGSAKIAPTTKFLSEFRRVMLSDPEKFRTHGALAQKIKMIQDAKGQLSGSYPQEQKNLRAICTEVFEKIVQLS